MDRSPDMIVGIDPGFSGAIALWDASGIRIHDMPTLPGQKGKVEYDLCRMASLLAPPTQNRNVVLLEKVHAMPKQGVSSTFRFGQGFGALQMAVTGHGYEIHYVTPQKWKRYFGLSSDKGVSRGLAMQRFPEIHDQFQRVKDDGRAEAALLALYAAENIILKK